MKCVIFWGRFSLIGLLVVMSVVVVLVLLFIIFPVDGVGVGRCSCPLLLEKLIVSRAVNKFPAFCGTL